MSAFDLLDDSFPHGSVEGYRAGCRGAVCPGAMACRDVYTRSVGDFGFAKKLAAGVPLEVILEEERAAARAAIESDKAARAAERAERQKAKKSRLSGARGASGVTREAVARLHGEGKSDRQIAAELNLAPRYVGRVRALLGLPINSDAPDRGAARAKVAQLHAEGKTDREMAELTGLSRVTVSWHRRELGLAPHADTSAKGGRAKGPIWDLLPGLHAEGLSDAEIAERTGERRVNVAIVRRRLGLIANRGPRVVRETRERVVREPKHRAPRPPREPKERKPRELRPHGTNAAFARGCRCEACVAGHKEYMTEWRRSRREAEVPEENHGTSYGYQLGCRSRKTCPAEVSCVDAMLEQDRERRRRAGVPERAPMVDAEPVRQHVRALQAAGWSLWQISQAAGVSFSILKALMYGRGAHRPARSERMEEGNASRLLAVGKEEAA